MRRLLVLCSAMVLLASGMSPASADDTTVPVKARPGPGEDYFSGTSAFPFGFGCDVGFQSQDPPFTRLRATDPAPPFGLGERSWGYQPQVAGSFYGVGAEVASAADLANFGMQVHGASTDAGRAVIFSIPSGTSSDHMWVGIADISGGGDIWTYVDAADLSYSWHEYDRFSWVPTQAVGMTGTLAAFEAEHGPSTVGYGAALGFGCDGDTFDYDGFRYGASGNVTTLDFERLTTSITIGATKKTIVAGKATRITGATSAQYFPDTDVDLELKAFGSDSFVPVATVEALPADDWKLGRDVKPLRQATYRWHYLSGTGNNIVNDPATSAELVINVKTALTAKVADSTIKRGQDIVFSGKTRPTKPGTTVTLWRKTSTGASLLATTTVKADGTYKFAHRAGRKGTWKVYATIPATPGNLAGTSPVRTVSVS